MASMTRNRCIDDHAPGPATVRYYAERAQDGPAIIITEGILVDWAGVDYPHPPFLVTESQAEAWKKVVDAVHAKSGSKIYWQAWHAGELMNETETYRDCMVTRIRIQVEHRTMRCPS